MEQVHTGYIILYIQIQASNAVNPPATPGSNSRRSMCGRRSYRGTLKDFLLWHRALHTKSNKEGTMEARNWSLSLGGLIVAMAAMGFKEGKKGPEGYLKNSKEKKVAATDATCRCSPCSSDCQLETCSLARPLREMSEAFGKACKATPEKFTRKCVLLFLNSNSLVALPGPSLVFRCSNWSSQW